MYYKLGVFGVDGETNVLIGTSERKNALNFLTDNDHEGSGVSLQIFESINDQVPVQTSEDPEYIYEVLAR